VRSRHLLPQGNPETLSIRTGCRRSSCGLSVGETAETLQVSADTATRDWRPNKVWPLKELRGNS
jgi:hypothetical protein